MGREIKESAGTITDFESVAPCRMERGVEGSDSRGDPVALCTCNQVSPCEIGKGQRDRTQAGYVPLPGSMLRQELRRRH